MDSFVIDTLMSQKHHKDTVFKISSRLVISNLIKKTPSSMYLGVGVKDDIWTWILVRNHESFPNMYGTWVLHLWIGPKSLGWMAQVEIWCSFDGTGGNMVGVAQVEIWCGTGGNMVVE